MSRSKGGAGARTGIAVLPGDKALLARSGAGRAVARLSRQVERGLATVDLTLPQYRVLGLLAAGSAASSAVASRLAVSRPSVTSVVDGLVARGLVERSPHPTDRRRLDLDVTDDGRRVLAVADESVAERLAAIASHLVSWNADAAVEDLEHWNDALDSYREERVKENDGK